MNLHTLSYHARMMPHATASRSLLPKKTNWTTRRMTTGSISNCRRPWFRAGRDTVRRGRFASRDRGAAALSPDRRCAERAAYRLHTNRAVRTGSARREHCAIRPLACASFVRSDSTTSRLFRALISRNSTTTTVIPSRSRGIAPTPTPPLRAGLAGAAADAPAAMTGSARRGARRAGATTRKAGAGDSSAALGMTSWWRASRWGAEAGSGQRSSRWAISPLAPE